MRARRVIGSIFAIAALVMSVGSPLAMAEDESTSKSTVNEIGDFTFNLHNETINFSAAGVSSSVGTEVGLTWPATNPHRVLDVVDKHSYNPLGYSLSISATDLTIAETLYHIDAENLSVRRAGFSAHSSCLDSDPENNTPIGGNPYQTITQSLTGDWVSLSDPVTIVEGSDGRGCRGFQINLGFKLYVPAGTYTGDGGTATYFGTVTVSNTLAPVAPPA